MHTPSCRRWRLSLLLAALPVLLGAAEPAWQPGAGPLLTRWGRELSPAAVLPEYPRPQMVRPDWQSLNGLWDYALSAGEPPAQYDGRILVPFPVESALSGVMKPVKPEQRLWYRRSFTVPAAWRQQRLLLHFGAVDWEAVVHVNGTEVLVHRGGYDAFSVDITAALRPEGAQELVVAVRDPSDAGQQARGKQVLAPQGIYYTATTGIWQTVWLEPVPVAHIESLRLVPDVAAQVLRIAVQASGGATVVATVLDAQRAVGTSQGRPRETFSVPIPDPKLWSPTRPFLYDLRVELVDDAGKVLDRVESYVGMRSIAMGKDGMGVNRLLLNGEPLFQVGTLDQGFWPDGLYTAPADAALKYDVEVLKRLGFNFTRKHVKVEPARWYNWCDRLGLLVWQDMPSGGNGSAEAKTQFEVELQRLVEGLGNSPCIIQWVVFNEGWGQYDTERLTAWTKQLDPSRLVNAASGWTDKGVGDLSDMHAYPGPDAPKPEAGRASVLGEFGGLGLGIPEHTWSSQSWGYRGVADSAALTRRYVKLLQGVWQLKETRALCAAVYTQTTDVETECNGLLTYDRAILKLDAERAAAANRGEFPPPPQKVVLAPSAEQPEPVLWRFTTTAPAAGWFAAEFDATGWSEGRAGFGRNDTPGASVHTAWTSADIWVRREFELGVARLQRPTLWIHHDEDVEVYLNGVLAAAAKGYLVEYEEMEIRPAAAATLKPGRNLIAIHCHQTGGGQYLDAGLVDLIDPPAAGR